MDKLWENPEKSWIEIVTFPHLRGAPADAIGRARAGFRIALTYRGKSIFNKQLRGSAKTLTAPRGACILGVDVNGRAAFMTGDVAFEKDAFRGQLAGSSEPVGPAAR